jgi:hypothetical protein
LKFGFLNKVFKQLTSALVLNAADYGALSSLKLIELQY